MPRTEPPETSTSRVALSIAGACLDLIDLAEEGAEAEALGRVAAILRAGRDLRPYQVEEVLGFVAARIDVDVPAPGEGKADGDDEIVGEAQVALRPAPEVVEG